MSFVCTYVVYKYDICLLYSICTVSTHTGLSQRITQKAKPVLKVLPARVGEYYRRYAMLGYAISLSQTFSLVNNIAEYRHISQAILYV